jgi:hypothetical protein
MTAPAAVLACALNLLGRNPASLPPIEFVAVRPPGLASDVEGFVRDRSGVISLITTSDTFQTLQRFQCRAWGPLRKLASVIVHEEWHVLHGGDERGAYQAQLDTLFRLGVNPASPLYNSVVRAMISVLDDTPTASTQSTPPSRAR